MQTYFSTFLTGFSDVIEKELKNRLKNLLVLHHSDGVIIYTTSSHINDIKRLGFLSNSFLLLKKRDHTQDGYSVEQAIIDTRNDPSVRDCLHNNLPVKNTSYRVMAKKENQLIKIDPHVLQKAERFLSSFPQLRLNRSQPDIEFWVLMRREGYTLIGMRLTKRGNYEKVLAKGELYPEFAQILCLLSSPTSYDVFLDPFCGSGAITLQRIWLYPSIRVIASDNDPQVIQLLKRKTKKIHKKIEIYQWDALHLSSLSDQSVDCIVTDPPWGRYEMIGDLKDFYTQMLKEICRVLKKDGRLIFLIADRELFDSLLTTVYTKQLRQEHVYTTLVSGRKACVYVLRRI